VDEIVVLDLESTDASGDLARAFGARVIERAPVPIVELVRNEVAAHASADWILVMDPDERVSAGLAVELRRVTPRDDIDAVVVPRMNLDFGHAPASPMHRYEPQIRMYRRSRVRWPERPNRLPDVAEEKLYRVPANDENVLVHDRSRNVPEVLERVIRYAPLEAKALIDAGETFSAERMFGVLREKAHKQFIRGDPWSEGIPGLLRALILFLFHVYIWAAFWQLSGARRTAEDDRFVRRLGRAFRLAWRAGGYGIRLFRRG
jgi:glycosyltransferase involved in cell wall biosynthesis